MTSVPAALAPAAPRALSASVRWALAGLSLSMLMASLDTSIANAGLPVLARAFGATFPEVQWIVLAYLLAITSLIVGAGRLGDLLGRRRLLLAGIGLFTLASLLCGLAPSLPALLAARAAQGLGAALMMALTVAFVGETVPRERTGRAMGLLGTMSALGTTLGPSVGGLLIAACGWRSLFLVNVPLGLLNLALAWRHLPADRPRTVTARAGFDWAGTLLLALTLGAYALALTRGPGRVGPSGLVLLVVAGLGGAGLVLVERRVAAPLLQLAIFRDPVQGVCLALSGLVSTVMMATLVVGPFYLTQALRLGTRLVGFALSAGPLVAALAAMPAGRLVDRLGGAGVTLLGLGGMATGAALLTLLPSGVGLAGYIGPIMVITSGYALFQVANNTLYMAGIAPDRRGVASGLLSLARNLGLITGASVMGAVFAAATAAGDLTRARPAEVATGMRVTYAVALGLVLVALALAVRTRRPAPLLAPAPVAVG
jgi:EmrB/QacA subfamily drug resistance transporter